MKRTIVILSLLLIGMISKAQDVELVINEQPRVFFEHTAIADNSTTFTYQEATYNVGSMLHLYHEQKFWDAPVFLHLEYQSTFNTHTAIAGASYSFYLPTGFVSIAPLSRYDWGINSFAVQLSNSYCFDWGVLQFYGYNHLWYNGAMCFFGEERMHIKLSKHYAAGLILDITHFGAWEVIPALGLRYSF